MDIVYLCHYFAPEIGAPAARGLEHCRRWAEQGHNVKVVTCFPNHPTGILPEVHRGKLFKQEKMGLLNLYRNYVFATPNEGFIKKTISHLSFMFSSVLLSLPRIGKVDVMIVSSPTFFSIFAAFIFKFIKRAPLIVEIRDLWPAAMVELGVLRNRLIISVLEKIELSFYRLADKVVVVTNKFKENIGARGISATKIAVITNGVNTDFFSFRLDERAGLQANLGLEGKFVVLYIGAHGISHALEKIIDVAALCALNKQVEIVFLFVGEGAMKAELMRLVQQRDLCNVVFLPAQPKEAMPGYYSLSHICLVPLKNIPLFETFIPSKMFEMMACERPIVASLRGEAAEILERSGAARVVEPEAVHAIYDAIIQLKDDGDGRKAMGEKGRSFVERHFSRIRLADDYLGLLHSVVKKK